MNDSLRRTLLFFGIIAIGLILIFIEIPILYLILIISLFGLFFLLITGSLTSGKSERTVEKGEASPKPSVPKGPTFEEKLAKKAPSFHKIYIKIKSPFSKLKGRVKNTPKAGEKEGLSSGDMFTQKAPAFHSLYMRIKGGLGRVRRSKAETSQDSATAKEMAISSGKGEGATTTGGAQSTQSGDDDIFGDINLDELDDEALDGLGQEDALYDMGQGDADTMEDDVASILAQAGDLDGYSEDGDLGQPVGDSLEDAFDDSLDGEFLGSESEFESINLDEIEIDDESKLADEPDVDEPADLDEMPEHPGDSKSGADAWATATTDDFDFEEAPEAISSNVGFLEAKDVETKEFSFAQTGSKGENDLLNELSSAAKTVRKKEDLSLIRDLKGVHVSPEELEEELSNLVTILGGIKDEDEDELSENKSELIGEN